MLVMALGSGFLFPQHTPSDPAYRGWTLGFVDYLFLAFTTAATFSPADALTARAKLLMMLEATILLVTVALVASCAVGILQ